MLLLSSVAPLSPILLDDKSSVVRFFHTWLLLSAVAPLSPILLDDKSSVQTITNTLSGVIFTTAGTISASSAAAGSFSSKLMIYLVATEAIFNMQYLNIQHSQIALIYYQKLSQALITILTT